MNPNDTDPLLLRTDTREAWGLVKRVERGDHSARDEWAGWLVDKGFGGALLATVDACHVVLIEALPQLPVGSDTYHRVMQLIPDWRMPTEPDAEEGQS